MFGRLKVFRTMVEINKNPAANNSKGSRVLYND